MFRTWRWCALPLGAVLLMAADASWKTKPIPQWDEADARQLLADSPWVNYVEPQPVRGLSPSERRDGGNFASGAGTGVGLAGIGILGARRQREALERAHSQPQAARVAVRWESALPVRIAEQKAGETGAPVLDGDDYAIAVYGIPVPARPNLASELKGVAWLSRDSRKDLKPSRVRILRHDDGTADLVYFFPRSVEIGKKEGRVRFAAQIDRLFVSLDFFTEDMQIQGELQLLMPFEGPHPAAPVR